MLMSDKVRIPHVNPGIDAFVIARCDMVDKMHLRSGKCQPWLGSIISPQVPEIRHLALGSRHWRHFSILETQF